MKPFSQKFSDMSIILHVNFFYLFWLWISHSHTKGTYERNFLVSESLHVHQQQAIFALYWSEPHHTNFYFMKFSTHDDVLDFIIKNLHQP